MTGPLTLDTLVKVVASDRSSMHGGTGKWTKGRWRSVTPPLIPCDHGLHVATVRQALDWLGPRIGLVEVAGERIDQDDKVIVERARVVEWLTTWNERSARHFAADCAAAVLPVWEARYPDDDRPRRAIEAARAYADGTISAAALLTAYSAAYLAADSAAYLAASSAADSAADSAAYLAASSAAYLAASSAAYSAASSAAYLAADLAQAENLLACLNGEKP
jgi:hypothetical protein